MTLRIRTGDIFMQVSILLTSLNFFKIAFCFWYNVTENVMCGCKFIWFTGDGCRL